MNLKVYYLQVTISQFYTKGQLFTKSWLSYYQEIPKSAEMKHNEVFLIVNV